MKLPSNIWLRIVALLVLAFLAHSAWLYVETHRLESAQAAIRARGEPVTFDELNTAFAKSASDSQPVAEDACRYYRAAAALVRPFPPRSNPFEHLAGATSAPAPSEIAWVRKAVDDNREAFSMMDEGARHGSCRPHVDRSYVDVGGLVRLTSLRTTLLAFDGDGDAAAEALSSGLRLSRAFSNPFGPLGSGYVLSTFNSDVRVLLERSRPSREALAHLRAALAVLGEPQAVVVHAAETVQVWAGSFFEPPEPRCSILEQALEPLRIHLQVRELGTAARLVAAARRPWPVERSTLEGLDVGRAWHFVDFRGFLSFLVRRVTQTQCTLVVLSLAQYRIEHGALPGTLAELPSVGVRADPLTDRPLLYRAEGSRITVYSVGGDYKDDGGLIGQRGDYDGADWGVSVTLR